MDTAVFEDAAIVAFPTRDEWDAVVAELVATQVQRWHLTVGEAYVGGEAASVLRVSTAEGTPAVLKVGFPHAEAIGEALALEAWAGTAPRVLRQDAWTWSLLLERVNPGTSLAEYSGPVDESIERAGELLCLITAVDAPAGIPALAEIVGDYRRDAAARLTADHAPLIDLNALELMELGLATIDGLISTTASAALLHGDFNPGNILRRDDGTWVVIDPKPMVGEIEFDLAPLVEQLGLPLSRSEPERELEKQLNRLVTVTGADASRAAQWAFVRSALNLSWALADSDRVASVGAVRAARAWAAIAGL